MKVRLRWLLGLLLLGTGFVRQTTPSGTAIEWDRSCPLLGVGYVAPGGPSADEVAAIVQEAIDAWKVDGCDGLPLSVSMLSPSFDTVAFDGFNVVITRPADYCQDPEHGEDELCLSPGTLATTTTFYTDIPGDPHDGELLEVDLEINLRHPFAADGTPGAYDLQSVVTHEMGHILGLEHSCTTERGARLVDPAGHAVPSCSSGMLDQAAANATMYPWVEPGDLSQRAPQADERQAMCLVYRKHGPRCEVREGLSACGCASHDPDALSGLLGVLGAILLLGRRRS